MASRLDSLANNLVGVSGMVCNECEESCEFTNVNESYIAHGKCWNCYSGYSKRQLTMDSIFDYLRDNHTDKQFRSCLLTKVLSTIKDGLVRYCNTKTSRNGVNNMWILKNSTSLLSSLDQLDMRTATSVQTFDFSTLYTSIPHDLLKSRISNLVHNAFRKKDGSVRYTHIKVTRAKGYFTHDINGGGDNMYTADNICKMIEFLIDNIFVQFGGPLFRQVIGI